MAQTLEEIKAAMAATNDLFNSEVFAKGNYDAFDQIYTENSNILPPGAPMISGRTAIKEFWASAIASLSAKSVVLSSVDVTLAGDGIVEIGKAVLTLQPEGQAAMDVELKYVVHWRQEEGLWKWHTDIWNMNA